ncbi:MAG: Ubiquinone biosynthesis accessory factor UbiK [Hyphomicrobiaceae bacterium hypho_1]
MAQTTGRFFDEMARFMVDTVGAAQGARKELETMIRSQADKVLSQMDIVRREEFEVVKAMAEKARLENEELTKKFEKLEIKLSGNNKVQ